MAHSFEAFMSDVESEGDTRVQEMQKAWQEQHPGEPYPQANGVGEMVGTPEVSKEATKPAIPTPEAFQASRVETDKKIQTALSQPANTDWPPAK
jgi:hypothetical protein